MSNPTIAVLSLQGCVTPHKPHIEACDATFLAAKTAEDIQKADALILPGGESTTMLKLIDTFNLEPALQKAFKTKPIWGICAGAILMAKTVQNPTQKSFGLLDITITRNAYGRQLQSTNDSINGYPVAYIRAPQIENVGKDIKVLANRNGHPTWLQQGKRMVTTFHPELTEQFPSPMHQHFINLI